MKKLLMITTTAIIVTSCQSKVETFSVKKRSLNEAVYASGEIMPSEYHFVKSSLTDRLLKLRLKEGNVVKEGEILAILGSQSENTQLEILERRVEIAQQNAGVNSAYLRELDSKIILAKQKHEQDLLNANRYSNLVEDKAVSEKDAEQAILQAKISSTEVLNLQQQYREQKNVLTNNLLAARQQLEVQRQSTESKILTSPINGKIFRINFKEGELVQAGQSVIMIGAAENFKLELLIDERDISKIRIGQTVYFETDAFQDKQWEASVSNIVPVLEKESRSFKVEAQVISDAAFYPQSSVEANIVIRKSIDALVIPSDYLLPGDTIIIKHGDEHRRTRVTAGMRNGNWVEIQRGLKVGDVIAKPQ